MLIQFENYLTFENIYLWSNLGILPFWLLIIFIPNSKISQILVNSIILPLLLASAYSYVIYQTVLMGEALFDVFKLYASIDNLYTVFSTEGFLLFFWLHFLSLNIFIGSWMSRDAIKYNMPRRLVFIPLALVYFAGPVGIVIYWGVRIFYEKKLGLHD